MAFRPFKRKGIKKAEVKTGLETGSLSEESGLDRLDRMQEEGIAGPKTPGLDRLAEMQEEGIPEPATPGLDRLAQMQDKPIAGTGEQAPQHGAGVEEKKLPVEINRTRRYKDFAYELRHGDGGAQIYWGCFLTTVTQAAFQKVVLDDGTVVHKLVNQSPIPNIERHDPSNLNTNRLLPTQLDWWGDVYLYWEVAQDGTVLCCDIRGPATPTLKEIPLLNEDLVRQGDGTPTCAGSGSGSGDECYGAYYVLLGTVPQNGPVDQIITSDVTWSVFIIEGSCYGSTSSISSSGSSGGSEGSGSGSTPSGGSGSGKDSCILSVPWGSGWTALWCVEAPDVLFIDWPKVNLTGTETTIEIDPKLLSVVKKGTLAVHGIAGDGGPVWCKLTPWGKLTIFRPRYFHKSKRVHLLLIGLRRDTDVPRWQEKTEEDFKANEERIKEFYPKEVDG